MKQSLNCDTAPKPLYERIYDLVREVPAGRVVTYGQIAALIGPCSARMVGYAMAALRNGGHADVPWQRVINAKGRISMHGIGSAIQRSLLEDEGIGFDGDDRLDLEKYRYWPGEGGRA